MEERLNLREFQARLAERLNNVSNQTGTASKLGFMAGGRHWLAALDQVGEVVTVDRLMKAPWTRPWFLGVAGVRGTIYGCTDLAAFLGLAKAEPRDEIRLLLANPRFNAHAAFRIDQVLGLRNVDDMRLLPDAQSLEAWQGSSYEDASGTIWQELSFENLVTAQVFLQVAA